MRLTNSAHRYTKKRYHARVVNRQCVTTDQLAMEIHESSTLTVADIKATLISLSERLARHLEDGKQVYVEGIGYFHISLTCPETRTPKSTRANKVKVKAVTFRANKRLKDHLQEAKIQRSKYKIHSKEVSEKTVEARLTEYFKTNPVLTRRKVEFICAFTQATAGRYIARLAKEGKLKNISTYYQPIYVPVAGYYGTPAPEKEE